MDIPNTMSTTCVKWSLLSSFNSWSVILINSCELSVPFLYISSSPSSHRVYLNNFFSVNPFNTLFPLLQPSLCPGKAGLHGLLQLVSFSSCFSLALAIGESQWEIREKRRVRSKLYFSTEGHNVYKGCPFHMTFSLKVLITAPSSCLFSPGTDEWGGSPGYPIHCTSPLPSYTLLNSLSIKLLSSFPNLRVSYIFYQDPD